MFEAALCYGNNFLSKLAAETKIIEVIVRRSFRRSRPLLYGGRFRRFIAVAAAFLPFVIPKSSVECLDDGGCSFQVLMGLAQLFFRGGGDARAELLEDGGLHLFGNEGCK